MKKCPFCREEIQEDAIKCRYCSSSLLPAQPEAPKGDKTAAPGPDQTQYIVDNGLLRFGKFVGGTLAIFITIGAFVWGFDVKEASKEARSALEEVNATQKKTAEIADSIDRREQRIKRSMDSLDEKLAMVSQEIEAIHRSKETADTFVQNFIARARSVTTVTTETPDKPHGGDGSHPNGGASAIINQVMESYGFTGNLDGKGETIGLIELGGGFRNSDIDTYFRNAKLDVPKISVITVDGGKNSDNTGGNEQPTFDIQITGTIVPKAHLNVYFTVNTNKGFVDAINRAIQDKVSVIAISWGSPEATWSKDGLRQMENAFTAAATAGITVIVAAGDQGATDSYEGKTLQVDFPASSPHVLACGGTKWTKTDEVVWNSPIGGSTGGGFSTLFPTPEWQAETVKKYSGKTGRGVPDVAANADPEVGYIVVVNGKNFQIGGTIAAVPIWSGVIAMINQHIGHRVGFINPLLYQAIGPAGALRDITKGKNSVGAVVGFEAGPGWDPCTGWGTPNLKKLLDFFDKRK